MPPRHHWHTGTLAIAIYLHDKIHGTLIRAQEIVSFSKGGALREGDPLFALSYFGLRTCHGRTYRPLQLLQLLPRACTSRNPVSMLPSQTNLLYTVLRLSCAHLDSPQAAKWRRLGYLADSPGRQTCIKVNAVSCKKFHG